VSKDGHKTHPAPPDPDNRQRPVEPPVLDAGAPSPPVNPGEALFRSNLEVVEWAIQFVCQKHGLSVEEAEDFSSHVRLKLMDDDYAALRKFRGESKLSTFLVATISYRFLDYRNALWGKWRPSAKAVRLGVDARLIEQLTHRDEYSDDEAFEILRTNHHRNITRPEFEAILGQLPSRDKRRFENDEVLESLVSGDSPDQNILNEEKRIAWEQLLQATKEALLELTPEERLLLKLFDEDGLHMNEVAKVIGGDATVLFRRRAQIRARVRKRLTERGFSLAKDLD
jgi:RNA polymerase sigma factor (sigma-70 family)